MPLGYFASGKLRGEKNHYVPLLSTQDVNFHLPESFKKPLVSNTSFVDLAAKSHHVPTTEESFAVLSKNSTILSRKRKQL